MCVALVTKHIVREEDKGELKETKVIILLLLLFWGEGQIAIVTGFWKTDQSATLGLFHFIGQLIDRTLTVLAIHSAITGLG